MLTLTNLSADLMGETIIEDFNFTLQAGKVACLYGPSGCGKTTILRLIAGIIDKESGTIDNQFARTTYLFQEHRLLPWRTAWENIALVIPQAKKAKRKAKTQTTNELCATDEMIASLLSQLALDNSDWHKYPHELSGGMRQRVALARALVTEPQLLLMDEPFSALDFELKLSLQNLILSRVLKQNMSIILVTHDRYEALRLANEIYILAHKKPTYCKGVIKLDTPHHQRDAQFIDTRLQKEFWQFDHASA